MSWKILSAQLTKNILLVFGVAHLLIAFAFLVAVGVIAVVSVAKAETLEPMELVAMCARRGNHVSNYAYLRDAGVTEKELVDRVKATNKKKEYYTPKQMENAVYNIHRVYVRIDLTEKEIYYFVYNDCINPKIRT